MQVSQIFSNNVRDWVNIDNKIKSAQEAIRILKKEKDRYGNQIRIYIKTNGLDEEPIGITGGKLKIGISKSTISISRPYVESRLT